MHFLSNELLESYQKVFWMAITPLLTSKRLLKGSSKTTTKASVALKNTVNNAVFAWFLLFRAFMSLSLLAKPKFDYFYVTARLVNGFRTVLRVPWASKRSNFVEDILYKSRFEAMRIWSFFQSDCERVPDRGEPSKWAPRKLPKPIVNAVVGLLRSSCSLWTPRTATIFLQKASTRVSILLIIYWFVLQFMSVSAWHVAAYMRLEVLLDMPFTFPNW